MTGSESEQALRAQRDKCWRAVVKMTAAAGPAWTPYWVLNLMDEDGNLPDQYPEDGP